MDRVRESLYPLSALSLLASFPPSSLQSINARTGFTFAACAPLPPSPPLTSLPLLLSPSLGVPSSLCAQHSHSRPARCTPPPSRDGERERERERERMDLRLTDWPAAATVAFSFFRAPRVRCPRVLRRFSV